MIRARQLGELARDVAVTVGLVVVLPVAGAAAGLLYGAASAAACVWWGWRDRGREPVDGARED